MLEWDVVPKLLGSTATVAMAELLIKGGLIALASLHAVIPEIVYPEVAVIARNDRADLEKFPAFVGKVMIGVNKGLAVHQHFLPVDG